LLRAVDFVYKGIRATNPKNKRPQIPKLTNSPSPSPFSSNIFFDKL
jgi:hypothetical protein